jgi:hypothetical protein
MVKMSRYIIFVFSLFFLSFSNKHAISKTIIQNLHACDAAGVAEEVGGGLAVAARCGCRQVSRDVTPPPYIPCCLIATLAVRILTLAVFRPIWPNEPRKNTRELSRSLARSLSHIHTLHNIRTCTHTHYRELQVVRMEAKLRSGQLPLSRITEASFVGRKLDLLRTRLADGGASAVTFSSNFLSVSVMSFC